MRFFNNLMPALEFSGYLFQFVRETLVLEPECPDPAHHTRWRDLQALYGSRVIPDQAVELLHGGPPGALVHHSRSSGLTSAEQKVGLMLLRCKES